MSTYLSIDEIGDGVLVSLICLLQLFHHKEAVAYEVVVSNSSTPKRGV